MKFLRVLLILIAVLIGGYLVTCLMGPKEFSVKRSRLIQADPKAVYEEVANFHQWPAWSPWQKRDPAIENTFSGSDAGEGAIMTWTSEQSGNGEQEIIEARDNEYLKMDLRFDGMQPNITEWFFEAKDGGTEVTWTMESGEIGFMSRGPFMLMGVTGMIEKDYEEGLASIASVAEAKPRVPKPEIAATREPMEAVPYLGVRRDNLGMDVIMAGEIQAESFGQLMGALKGDHSLLSGMPMTISHRYDPETMIMDLEFAVPVSADLEAPEGVSKGLIPAGECVWATHYGAYESLAETWDKMERYMAYHKLTPRWSPYEVYVTDPMTEPDTSKWETRIVYPI